MIRIRRRWWRLGVVAVLVAVGWSLFIRRDAQRASDELLRAQEEVARGRLGPARQRLTALTARPGAMGGAADYWLGVCEALGGNPDAALRAFAQVPEDFAYDDRGAYLEARANMTHGRLGAAERRLEKSMARGGRVWEKVRSLLSEVYQLEVRFDDDRAMLLASLANAKDPIILLKLISNLELDRLPYDGLLGALEHAARLAPEEDRVWLGKARLAIESGRWDDAAYWLRRCRDVRADAPVWKAWLEWARGTGRPDEALEAARHLGSAHLDPGERLALRAWLFKQRGDVQAESAALEQWLRVDPAATRAMERLTELAQRAGQPDRVAELRRRKAEAERALDGYRRLLWRDEPPSGAAERSEMARLAEAAGRRPEARALYTWSLAADSKHLPAEEGLARLDRADALRRLAVSAETEPWPEPLAMAEPARAVRAAVPAGGLNFVDDAETVGLRFVYDNAETPIHQQPEPIGGGLALLDFDGDGWLDVYCVQGGPFTPSSQLGSPSPGLGDRLFHNRGDGTFEDVTESSGIAGFTRGHGHGVAVGDVDADGLPDLFVTRWRSYALYRNRGDGTFEDATLAWGLGGRRDWPTSAAFADLDGDGDLDLYVCHYVVWDLDNPRICREPKLNAYLNCSPLDSEALPDHLFRNDAGRFVDVTTESGIVDRDGRGLGVIAADLDQDGKVDLFVANDSSANFLYHNIGGMRFEEVGHAAGVAGNASGGYQAGMGAAAGDLDGDGLIDLVVTNFYGESTTFYRNLGGGSFFDASAATGLAVASRRLLGFGVALFDANNDSRLDLASANGHVNDLRPNYPYKMPAQLLLGSDDGRLSDVSDRAGSCWLVPRMGRGLAVGDLDNDGRQDVLILSHNTPLAYFHNRTKGGRFLSLRLAGRKSNRDAVGAKVVVIAGGRRRVGQRVGGGSYQSASDSRLHFGLGAIDRIEAIEITWPSGTVDRYQGLRADTGYLLCEGQDEPRPLAGFSKLAPSPRTICPARGPANASNRPG